MTELIARLKDTARKEMRYARGMQTMHRERYIEYCRDLRRARARGEEARVHEIIQALMAFTNEMHQLIEQRRRTYERMVMLNRNERITSPPAHPDDVHDMQRI